MRGQALGIVFVFLFGFSIFRTSTIEEIITPSQFLKDGETLISTGRKFELGFFSPEASKGRYLGLWYMNISPKIFVWVANREFPLSNNLGALNITSQGVLVLTNSTNNVVWSSNASRTVQDPVAELLDSGNLVVRERHDDKEENFLWQSFDYPCDTLLPGMKIGVNFQTGFNRFLSSWKSIDDPAQGQFSFLTDLHGYPQEVLRKGNKIVYRGGSWNGLRFTGTPDLKPSPIFTYEFVFNDTEVYFRYDQQHSSSFPRYTLSPSGVLQRFLWSERSNEWVPIASAQKDQCDNYALCGENATCNITNFPVCVCLDGFIPKSARNWNSMDWLDGCFRRTPLDCSDKDGFLKYSGMKLPDTSSSWYNKRIDLNECKAMCLKNCSCSAYANLDISAGGSGCLIWFGKLIDMRIFAEDGQDIYIKLAASELGKIDSKGQSSKKKQIAIIACSVITICMLIIVTIIYLCKSHLRKQGIEKRKDTENTKDVGSKEDMELPIFDLTTIENATKNFANSNKIGEGGFGPVYKGTLIEGQEVAVKRLSKSSGQGVNEFKNEVMLIAKLQHRNLVKLLGCCIHEDEKMLVYEYMPNKSLDSFIFDDRRSKLLDWQRRIHIIGGIARGLLYLHQDSRLRIIHRDLKASNILLDNEMNPKISDFGLARTFGGDQTEANTNRVVGTYGYMSPEYAMNGLFSVKSDVFSFGVLVLEVISGKKNRGILNPDHDLNLLGYAWMLWGKGTPLQLIDENLNDSCTVSEVLRCFHVALLCVQQRPEDRPNMSSVVLMLGSENPLPEPKQPGFYMGRNPPEAESSSKNYDSYPSNEVTITLLEAR